MENFWQDVKYGARMLAANRGFTFVAIATLALGIGANSAIFSVIDAVLLRPLPYEQPDQLMLLSEWSEQVPGMSFSAANFKDVRDATRVRRYPVRANEPNPHRRRRCVLNTGTPSGSTHGQPSPSRAMGSPGRGAQRTRTRTSGTAASSFPASWL